MTAQIDEPGLGFVFTKPGPPSDDHPMPRPPRTQDGPSRQRTTRWTDAEWSTVEDLARGRELSVSDYLRALVREDEQRSRRARARTKGKLMRMRVLQWMSFVLVVSASAAHAQRRTADQQMAELEAQSAARKAAEQAQRDAQQRAELQVRAEMVKAAVQAREAEARAREAEALAREAAAREQCAASFPARLADAKQALIAYDEHLRASKAAAPAIEWFEAHCRFLTELEIAIRKLDDENSFVCDPKAKGRPRKLTAELVLQYSTEPTLGAFQEHHGEDQRCLERDPIALVYPEGITDTQRLELLCWDDPRENCEAARKTIAAVRAKGIR